MGVERNSGRQIKEDVDVALWMCAVQEEEAQMRCWEAPALFFLFFKQKNRRKERGARGGIFQKRKYPCSLQNMHNLNKLVWQFLEEEK